MPTSTVAPLEIQADSGSLRDHERDFAALAERLDRRGARAEACLREGGSRGKQGFTRATGAKRRASGWVRAVVLAEAA